MSQSQTANFDLTHLIVNYQSAQLRGHLAYLNALNQLSHEAVTPEKIKDTEKSLMSVMKWNKDLLSGMPIFSVNWRYPETTDAQKAMDLLGKLKIEVKALNENLSETLSKPEAFSDDNSIKFLIACSIRYAYSRENFLKGLVEYSKFQSNEQLVEAYSAELVSATEELKKISLALKEFRQQGKLSQEKTVELKESIVMIQKIFKSYEHDLNHYLSIFHSAFTFEHAEFSEEEAAPWQALNFTAQEAGYWRAYGFQAEAAVEWFNGGIIDPATAFLWTKEGFIVQTAIGWIQLGVDIKMTKDLIAKGHTPNTVYEHLIRQAQKSAA